MNKAGSWNIQAIPPHGYKVWAEKKTAPSPPILFGWNPLSFCLAQKRTRDPPLSGGKDLKKACPDEHPSGDRGLKSLRHRSAF